MPTPTLKAKICEVMKLTKVNVAVPERMRMEPPISVEMLLMNPGTTAKKLHPTMVMAPPSMRMSPPKMASGMSLITDSRTGWMVKRQSKANKVAPRYRYTTPPKRVRNSSRKTSPSPS